MSPIHLSSYDLLGLLYQVLTNQTIQPKFIKQFQPN